MKLQNVALGCLVASSALAAGNDVDEDDIFDELVGQKAQANAAGAGGADDESLPSTGVDHPQWVKYEDASDAFFFEQFDSGAEKRWKPSNAKKDEEFSYVGKWAFEEATVLPGFKGDRGMVVKNPAAHHAITTKFDKPFDNKDKTMVLQYEVKLQKGLECGGAYMKLLSENKELHAEEFNGETPYQVMFGPDKCGSTNKVHFIVRRKNPISGEYEEKHLTLPPVARLNKLTNLYTLIIKPDQEFEVRVNGEIAKSGNMVTDGLFTPAFDPATEVEDENDEKPEDWVDEEYIPDPEQAEKPEDWDEDAPVKIADPEAVKPSDWLDDEPDEIEDPEAEKPEDWDDEEDGEWIAPLIDNPACLEVSGCGEWQAPLIKNPDYKGKWVQPKIKNPEYKGVWSPRLIPNPNFFEDKTPSDLEPIGAIGFELWTMQEEILFNNIYLGHSVEQAEAIGNATFVPKLEIEKAEEQASAPPPTKDPKRYDSAMDYFREDPFGFIIEQARVFVLNFTQKPFLAIQNQPLVAGLFGIVATILFTVGFGLLGVLSHVVFGPSKKPAQVNANAKGKGKKAEKTGAEKEGESKGSATGKESSTSATKRKA